MEPVDTWKVVHGKCKFDQSSEKMSSVMELGEHFIVLT